MERRKLTKEDLDKVRNIEGFPIGTDEDIIALSDPPYYTACPNPFIEDFIKEHGTPYDEATDDYHCEPFAADVSEGKKDPVYNAHSYHTKVPYKAIMRYILHYTKPGDIIFDGFSGTGMTGFASKMCGLNDYDLCYQLTGKVMSDKWGERNAIISDLSPAASFIASVYNTPVDVIELKRVFRNILEEVQAEYSWIYTTQNINGQDCHVNYTVWSDVFVCPNCGNEFVFWDVAVDKESGSVKNIFNCPHCSAILTKKSCAHSFEMKYDDSLDSMIKMTKQVPVLISFDNMGKEYTKVPDDNDFILLKRIEDTKIPFYIPKIRMPKGAESRRNDKYGVTHAHHFFTKRNLYVLSALWNRIENYETSRSIKNSLKAIITGVMQGTSKLQRFRLNSTFPNMILSGTLYIGSMVREWNVIDWIIGKEKSIRKLKEKIAFMNNNNIMISTNSLTDEKIIPDNTVDYIFTDPPFGANLNYSELSFMWESWLHVITDSKPEAIVNSEQNKEIIEYTELMLKCFREYYRVLKPNRWITIEFHNSKNAVWNAIQESLIRAGFVIADVRTLDKKQSSFKQLTSSSAVKQDLVISAYKPKDSFKRTILEQAGKPETAWAFVQQHLANLPVVVDADNNGKIDILPERQAFLLFDRMVAYHIMQGIPVPLDASDFYNGLDERFMKRDGMYFLSDQVNEYDEARIKMDVENIEMSLFVTNEKSAIAWLYQQLGNEMGQPQTYAELQPKFMQEVRAVDKYEDIPELQVLLEENFLQDSEGKWYIPDRTKEGDVAKLREKKLLKEFEGYCNSKGKLKLFRSEAIRLGFTKMWKEKNYQGIVALAKRLPEQVIQEDQNLLMYYDLSLDRV